MNSKDFNQLVDEQFEIVKSILCKKQGEYNLNMDRLAFFKHNGDFLQTSPEFALWAMVSKHIISLTEMIKSEKVYSEDVWTEKITDTMNYLLLLKGVLVDTGRLKKDN